MPPKPSITLTEAELRIMRILWSRGESSVSELQAAMPDGAALAYNSVLTTVRILDQKGYVRHRQAGRAFLYTATVAERDARRSEVRHVLDRFFQSSPERLLLSVLGEGEITAAELQRLKDAIAEAEAEAGEPVQKPESSASQTQTQTQTTGAAGARDARDA